LQIEGRSLQPEMITLGGDRTVSAGREADWGRELTRSAVISAVCVARHLGPDFRKILGKS